MIVYDFAILIGVGCMAYAGYQVHPALPWLVCGASAAGWGYLGAVTKLRKGKEK